MTKARIRAAARNAGYTAKYSGKTRTFYCSKKGGYKEIKLTR